MSTVPALAPSVGALRHAETDADLTACLDLLRQLRPHVQQAADFVVRARQQQGQGWRLLAHWHGQQPRALAGYRWLESLVHGRFVYVDDLVTDEAWRGGRLGAYLLGEVEALARAGGAAKLVLDAAMANSRAHRFYFGNGLLATGLHFTKVLA